MRDHNVPLCTMWDVSPLLLSPEADEFHLPEVPPPGARRKFFLQALVAANTKSKFKLLSLVWILTMFLQIKLRWD